MYRLTNFYNSRWFNVALFIMFLCLPFLIYWDLFISNKSLVSGDGIQYYSLKSLIKFSLAQGEFPLWNKYLANGTPFASDFTNNAFYPFAIILSLLPFKLFIYSYYALHLAIGSFFTYLFIKELGCGKIAALCTALIYELSIHMGGYRKEHITILATIIYLPVILYFIQKYMNTRSKKWLLFSSVAMAFQFYVAFIQDVVYTDIAVGIFLLIMAIHNRMTIKKVIADGLVWVGSYFGLIAFQLLPTVQLVREYAGNGAASASIDYFQFYSIHFSKLAMMLFPRIFGENVFDSFGAYFSSGFDIELFLGVFVFLILLFGIIRYFSDFRVKVSLGMMIGVFLFSASTHIPLLSELLYRIPGINGFRVPSRSLFIFIFFALVLFAVTLSKLRMVEQMKKIYTFSRRFVLGTCALLGCALFANTANLMSDSNFDGAIAFYQYFKTAFLPGLVALFSAFIVFYVMQKWSKKWSKEQYKKAYGCLGVVIVLVTLLETYSYSTVSYARNIDDFVLKDEASQFISDNVGDFKVWDASVTPSNITNINANLFKGFSSINAYIPFNNPRLYKLFSNTDNQVPLNNTGLLRIFPNAENNLVEHNDLLSMLGIKYIIDSGNLLAEETETKKIVKWANTIYKNDSILVPDSTGEVFVYSQPVEIKPNTFYKVKFNLESVGLQSLFYVDFYGGEKYDLEEQQKVFNIQPGASHYSAVIYSGDTTGIDEINLRIVSTPTSDMQITDFSLVEAEMQIQEHVYKPVFVEGPDRIFENTNAKDILYAPQETQSIENASEIYTNRFDYDLSNVSYVENFKNMDLKHANTTISDENFKNNSISAKVHSDKPSFINFSQNYYPGWKAKVNGKETPIYMVNGLIQGIEVPAGDSEIKFYFYPKVLFVGGFITLLTLGSMVYLIFRGSREKKVL